MYEIANGAFAHAWHREFACKCRRAQGRVEWGWCALSLKHPRVNGVFPCFSTILGRHLDPNRNFKPDFLQHPTIVAGTGTCARPECWRSQRSKAHKPTLQPDASPDADPQMYVRSVRYGRCACAKTSGKKYNLGNCQGVWCRFIAEPM